MDEHDLMADRFQALRPQLKAVAYRMLGSLSEADDAVQEAWLRLNRADTEDVENLGGWLTTVVGRVCLDMLRRRVTRREAPLDERIPDPIISGGGAVDPENEVLLADSVGLALLVVLQSLTPAERLAFVLHDMFAVPFDEIAPIVGRSTGATKMLASRARRRVRGAAPVPDPDLTRQRQVVDAFLTAARGGDFDGLLSVLDPDVVLRAEESGGLTVLRGARGVARRAETFQRPGLITRPVLVNGCAGFIMAVDGEPMAVASLTITGGKIAAVDILAEPERLRQLDLTAVAR